MEQSAESSGLKNKPWSKQSFLKEERVPTIQEIIGMAETIGKDRDRALVIMTYLTAGRIREVIRRDERPSIKKSDFKIVKEEGRDILLINMRNQKNKDRKRKDIPVPLDLKENALFWNMLTDYLNSLSEDEELFPITYQTAYEILTEKYDINFNPHWFRHVRLTHLVVVYGYKEFQLVRYAGWSDSRPAKRYVEMTWKDLLY